MARPGDEGEPAAWARVPAWGALDPPIRIGDRRPRAGPGGPVRSDPDRRGNSGLQCVVRVHRRSARALP